MTKTVSTRIEDRVHQELIDRCNKEGCTVAHFLYESIQLAITGTSAFNFGDDEEDYDDENRPENYARPVSASKSIPNITI